MSLDDQPDYQPNYFWKHFICNGEADDPAAFIYGYCPTKSQVDWDENDWLQTPKSLCDQAAMATLKAIHKPSLFSHTLPDSYNEWDIENFGKNLKFELSIYRLSIDSDLKTIDTLPLLSPVHKLILKNIHETSPVRHTFNRQDFKSLPHETDCSYDDIRQTGRYQVESYYSGDYSGYENHTTQLTRLGSATARSRYVTP